MTETCLFLDLLTDTFFFEVQKGDQNDGFGSKLSSRKKKEVRLSPEQVGHFPRCCVRAITIISLLEHSFGLILGLWGPLYASRGQTKQTTVGIKVVYGILEQVGSVQQTQK